MPPERRSWSRRDERTGSTRSVSELPGATAIACDVSETLDRERLIREVLERHGTIDVLVNNAGVGHTVSIEDETLDVFRQRDRGEPDRDLAPVEARGRGDGRASGAAASSTSRRCSGVVGSTPVKQAHYSASKGAVINLTRELACQWARKGVRVNALGPGLVPQRDDGGDGDRRRRQPVRQDRIARWPRMGEGHELDGALLLLASRRRQLHHRPDPARRRRLDRPLTRVSWRRQLGECGDEGGAGAGALVVVARHLRRREVGDADLLRVARCRRAPRPRCRGGRCRRGCRRPPCRASPCTTAAWP